MNSLSSNPLRRQFALALSAFALALPLAVAQGTITTYTDRAAFMAALAGASTTTQTFDTPATFALGDNLYNGVDYRVTGTSVGGNNIAGGLLNGDEFTASSVDYLFGFNVYAIGADFTGARTASGLNWVINGISTPVFSAAPGTGFFGIISTDAFTLVDVNSGPPANEIYTLDNLTYATSQVPEPGTVALLGLGAVGLLGTVRRRLRTA